MDPDVAHPRHQSNQTVRNREGGVEGGWGGVCYSGCFPLKVVPKKKKTSESVGSKRAPEPRHG